MDRSLTAPAVPWSETLGRVVAGAVLSAEETDALMADVLAGKAVPEQLAGLLCVLRSRGVTADELSGFARALRAAGLPLPVSSSVLGRAVDTCGTGGDGAHTINVSTLAALVVAGAGVPVVKHGNRASSSLAGSADVLEALGVVVDLPPPAVIDCLHDSGIGFCFAPRFHPALRHAAPVRRALGIGTIFNLLGPLANPAGVKRQVVGVSHSATAHLMMSVLVAQGSEHVFVVHGHDGLDEVTTTTTTAVVEFVDGETRSYVIDPTTFGIDSASTDALRGGVTEHNAQRARAILNGEAGPQADLVAVNAAAAFLVADEVTTWGEGVELARAVLGDGRAAKTLEQLVSASARTRPSG